ncbi:AsnC family transcriptional regulator [Microbacterium sp. SORGH_AS_0428]|uniref:AsnC family transcriptional regulator n=1 Tax=Microbacterium sp. SORGH_AS_0428 TaxID=3041788 RepID=UPI0037C5BFC4
MPDSLSELDLAIVHALQIDARAPWARIAARRRSRHRNRDPPLAGPARGRARLDHDLADT